MICLRCGYCCTRYMVVIVDNPEKGIAEDNLIGHNTKGKPGPCKHLLGNKIGGYACALHEKPYYKDTPCYSHTQVETGNEECRLGRYIIDDDAQKKGE
jgi:hypothetical protein